MAKSQKSNPTKAKKSKDAEVDGVYLLKMVMYLIIGSQWLWLQQSGGQRIPLPLGLILGLVFAWHDHFRMDRKIEYAVLLVAALIGYVSSIGIFISL